VTGEDPAAVAKVLDAPAELEPVLVQVLPALAAWRRRRTS
jgi:hypothetical protein